MAERSPKPEMLTHDQVWQALDALAAHQGMSISGLARFAGLDATTFNPSKRGKIGGPLRWPSTESIAKVLAATGVSIDRFLDPIAMKAGNHIPCRLWDDSSRSWFTPAGRPAPGGWDEIAFPDASIQNLFALEIRGDRFLPVYSDGDIIIVSANAELRRGDRALVVTTDDRLHLLIFVRRTETVLHMRDMASENTLTIPLELLRFLRRIIWVSQ
jgi:phage repressor protein C with HTH and peptisase S24 domain